MQKATYMLDTNDHIDHQRWLIENGFINDLHKDNLYMYGALVHKDILAVEVKINVEEKRIDYELYMTPKLLKKVSMFKKRSVDKSVIGLWLFKRMLKNDGNLNFPSLLNNFVKDYLGPKWSVTAELKDINKYEEGFEQESAGDKPADKSPQQE